jgi:acyl-ACP thioesterase
VLAVATSGWLVMKVEAKRPARVFPEVLALAEKAPPRALDDAFADLARPAGPDALVARIGRYDLDLNAHANNVSILKALFDALPEAPAAPFRTSVEFRGESFEGDVLRSRVERVDGGVRHELVRESDGREVARAFTRPAH